MFDSLQATIGEKFSPVTSFLKETLFGKNNERLDFVLDSFYKLPPERRMAVVGVGVISMSVMVIGIFGLYFSRVEALDKSLNESTLALREFRIFQIENKNANSDLNLLKKRIKSKMKGFSIKPFFEKMSVETSTELRSTKVKDADTVDLEELSSFLKEKDVEVTIPKISLPKLLKFISSIEKKKKYIRVKDLRVRDLSGKKLYFEAQIVFRAFQLS